MGRRVTSSLLLATALVVVSVAVAAPASGDGASSATDTAAAAKKKCKKGAAVSKKKCKRRKPATPPATTPPATTPPVVTPPGPAPASLSISPTSHDFGPIIDGGYSGNQTFTVTNDGASPSGTLASSRGGTHPTNFEISANMCDGISLAGGSSCTLDVRCVAVDAVQDTKTATLTVAGLPGGSPSASLTCLQTT